MDDCKQGSTFFTIAIYVANRMPTLYMPYALA